MKRLPALLFAAGAILPMAVSAPVAGQTSVTPPPPSAAPVAPYGLPVTPQQARAVAGRIEAEKLRRGIDTAAIAVVDPAGRLVYFERQDNATFANGDMAILKGRAAARLRRPTSVDATRLKGGDMILLLVPGAFPADGGVPIIKNGRLIGAVGVAGGAEDGPIAQLGVQTVN